MLRAAILFTVLCRLASGQCAMPPDIATLTAEQARARISSGATDFFLYKRLIDVTPIRPKPGVLAPDFKKLLDAHSEDPRFLYLYGRALIGKDTPQGLVLLRRAAALAPKLPWTYPALAEIYASPNFHDEQGLLAAMSDFRKLCPSNVEGFRYLDHVKDARQAGGLAVELRTLLEGGTGSEQAPYWRLLWGAEFRAAPESQYPGLRDRVAADLQKLARLADGTPDMQYTLKQGYELAGKPEAAAKADDGCGEYMKAYRAWESKHQLRTRDDITPEEYQLIWREEAVLAADWVRKWPSCILAWSSRLSTLRFTPEWTKADVELAGERILQLDRARQIGWSYYPEKLGVAQAWIRYGVRLHESLQMAEDALEQISLGPEQPSDLSAKAADFRRAKQERFGFDHLTWNAMRAVVDAGVQLKDMAKARAMLARMQAWVEQNADRKSDRSSGVERFERLYTTYQGKVAEAEGRKLDALAFYAKALSGGRPDDDDLPQHAAAMWVEAGGAKESWLALTTRPAPPKPDTANAATAAPAPAFALFEEVGKPLPEFKLRDVAGNTWTLDTLKGKRTLVNVWATWCGPCREEFPALQRLHELTKGRDDVQVITFNVDDENPGLVAPFLSTNKATFPVLVGARPT